MAPQRFEREDPNPDVKFEEDRIWEAAFVRGVIAGTIVIMFSIVAGALFWT